MKTILLIFFVVLWTTNTSAQGLRTRGAAIVNAEGKEVILRGMGLGGWMLQEPYMLQLSGIAVAQYDIRKKITELVGPGKTTQFYEAWLANHCTKADIDSLACWEFNSVRLPMHYNLFTLPVEEEPEEAGHTWLGKGFAMVDSLLSWCESNRVYLILDLHAAPGGQGNDNAIADRDTSKSSLWQNELNRKKTIALWQKLAERYAGEEWIGAYDIINEPNWGFQDPKDRNGCAETANKELRSLLEEITYAIRKVDKKHMIIIEGNCWGNNYDGVWPLWDDNMVISFHKYWNYTDQASIQKFLDYRIRYNVPIWMGESGENSNLWFTNAISLLEQNRIGWAWWPLKKSGINNPLEVKINPGYRDIINYWRGNAPRPDAATAYKALMQFAADTRISNNIVHRDVVDALNRQVNSTAVIPFNENVIRDSAIVFAPDYDLGRMGFAYHDNDSGTYWVSTGKRTDWNRGRQYRNDGVDIDACTDSNSNGYCVGWTEENEWLNYTLLAEKAGGYDLHIRYSATDTGSIAVTVNNTSTSSVNLVPVTAPGGWQNAKPVRVELTRGINNLRIHIVKGGFKLNYFQFITGNNTANTY